MEPPEVAHASVAQKLNAGIDNHPHGPSMTSETPNRRRTDQDPQIQFTALVADDDPHYLAYASGLLRRLGMFVLTAKDGAEALDIFRRGTRIDFALIDFGMPKMNGLEVIRAVRADVSLSNTYAVMLTADDRVETKVHALNDGYDDFLSKACSEIEIVAKVVASRRLVARQLSLDLKNQELYGLAVHDELTGIYNRRYFFAALDALLANTSSVCLVLFDLDDFKKVNDSHGHMIGDRVLTDVASALTRGTRYQDLLARYGGDEFIMLVTGTTIEEAQALAERIIQEVEQLQWMANEEIVRVAATYGVASAELLEDRSSAQLLSACDHDLYTRKYLRKHPQPREPEQTALPEAPPAKRKQAG